MAAAARLPNVLVCGTPGVGKTSLCELVADRTALRHIRVGDIVKDKGLHAGRDDALDTLLIDEASEDKVRESCQRRRLSACQCGRMGVAPPFYPSSHYSSACAPWCRSATSLRTR